MTGAALVRQAILRWLYWLIALVGLAALFAQSIRSQLPVAVTIGFALATGVALGRLSLAERSVDQRPLRWASLAVFVLAAALTLLSVAGAVPDTIGFSALAGGIYAAVRFVNSVRRWSAARSWAAKALLAVSWGTFLVSWIPAQPVRFAAGALCVFSASWAIEVYSELGPGGVLANRYLAGALGAGVVVVTWALLRLASVSATAATWTVVGLGVLTALMVTTNDAPVLVAALLVAAVWSTLPREVSPPPGQAPVVGEPYFAVLGDSYISGEGADRFFSGTNTTEPTGNQCRRAPTAWPLLLNPLAFGPGDELGIPARVAFLACSGATTGDIRESAAVGHGGERQSQLAELRDVIAAAGPPRFVIVSVGGNDVQFADVGAACIAPGNCAGYVQRVSDSRLAAVGQELVRTYAEIRLVAGEDVPLLVSPYPTPIYSPRPGDPSSEARNCSKVMLSAADIDALNAFAARLDETIARSAASAGAAVIDTLPGALRDAALQLCDPHNHPGLNFADPNPKAGSLWAALWPPNWTHNFIHPNAIGHRALAAAALDWFAGHRGVWSEGALTLPLSEQARQAAAEAPALPRPIPLGPTVRAGIAARLPHVLLLFAVGTLGWWLTIIAIHPPLSAARLRGAPVRRVQDRARSVLEEAVSRVLGG